MASMPFLRMRCMRTSLDSLDPTANTPAGRPSLAATVPLTDRTARTQRRSRPCCTRRRGRPCSAIRAAAGESAGARIRPGAADVALGALEAVGGAQDAARLRPHAGDDRDAARRGAAGGEERRRRVARAEHDGDDAVGAGGERGLDERPVAAQPRGDDLDARVELRDRQRRAPGRARPDLDALLRDAPERAARRGDENARGETESDLRTARAACSSPANATTAPSPAVAASPAARTASSRFAGPSAPARGRRPDRAGDDDRRSRAVQQVAQHRGLLERVGAVREHDAAPGGGLGGRGAGDLERVGGAHVDARPAAERARLQARRRPRAPARRRPARPRRAAARRPARPPSRSSRRPRAPSPRAREAWPDPIPRLAPATVATANFRVPSAHAAPFGSTRLPPRQRPTEPVGLYDPGYEHDACGVAFVARLSGEPSHETVQRAITALENLEHRGAAGADPNTGDGAGMLLQMPDELMRGLIGEELPPAGEYGVAVCFLPQDDGAPRGARAACSSTPSRARASGSSPGATSRSRRTTSASPPTGSRPTSSSSSWPRRRSWPATATRSSASST